VTPKPTQHPWSSEALFNKALLYVGEMEEHPASEWQFGLWSSLSLELLARAAVAKVSPTLLANRRDWHNVYHALGHPATVRQFTPVSVTTNEVLGILREILPDFTDELFQFCVKHCAYRNAELHSGEEVFADFGTSKWLAKYYACCDVFLRSMGRTLHELVEDAQAAKALIASLTDTAAKTVEQDIKKHLKLWESKTPAEQEAALAQATSWASRHAGHRVQCPACGSPALVRGSSHGVVTTEVREDEDVIVQRQNVLPSSFECVACELKIAGLSKLSACGLGDAFTATSTWSAAEFFGLHTADELEQAQASSSEPEFEEDFNE
jgi:hypothetical protein